jgi:hypothetical protein
MCSVALFNWLAANKTAEDFKETGSPQTQQFIKGLEDLKGQIEDWLDLYEVAVLSNFLCKFFMSKVLVEWQILPNFSYRVCSPVQFHS